MRYLLPFFLLLLALPAGGQTWTKQCGTGQAEAITAPGGIAAGQWACFDPASSGDDSPILSVAGCERTNWALFDDKDGDGTASTFTYTIETCPDPDLTGSTADNGCAQVDGTSALSGDSQEAAIGAGPFLRAEEATTGANVTDGRIIVHCARGVR